MIYRVCLLHISGVWAWDFRSINSMVSCLLIFAGLFSFCCFLLGSYWERKKSWVESHVWKNVRKKSALFHLRGFNKARYSTPLEEFLVTFWLIAWKVRGGWQNGRIFWRNWTVRPPKSQSYTCLIFQGNDCKVDTLQHPLVFRETSHETKKSIMSKEEEVMSPRIWSGED